MRFQILVTSLAALALAGCSTDPPKVEEVDSQANPEILAIPVTSAEKYESPEAAFRGYQVAAKKGDFVIALQCMAEESQTVMTGSIVIRAIQMGRRHEETRLILEQVFQKYGIDHAAKPSEDLDLTDQIAYLKWAAEPVVDKPQCVGSLCNLFKALGKMSGEIPMADGELKNLKVEGDAATAVVSSRQGETPLEFVKESGSWRIQFPKEVMSGKS
jgi:hypothetical protein